MYKKLIPVVIAIIGFGGAYLGAKIGASSSYQIQKMEGLQSLRSDVYGTFFNAQAKYLHYSSKTYTEPKTNQERMIDEYKLKTKEARLRLAAFAPSDVVNNLFEYYKNAKGFSTDCSSNWKSDAAIYTALRNHILSGVEKNKVSERAIYALMFDCLPSENDGIKN